MRMKLINARWTSAIIALGATALVSAGSGTAFSTFNPWVDGMFKSVCKNSIVNCNVYGAKTNAWLNGGPRGADFGPDGDYFFAVLTPGGQMNPNDGGTHNLSDDYDLYTNRTFAVTGGVVSFYGGTHDQDSGDTLDTTRAYCSKPNYCAPNGYPPLIRLSPYADTWNSGGVYILAVCSLAEGYPVNPNDCKYDAFRIG